MGKAKVGVLLAAAYGVGVVVLLVVALALPCGTLPRVRSALERVPEVGHRAAQLVRVAAHAGSLGLKHLQSLEPQGVSPRKRTVRFCVREAGFGETAPGCGSAVVPPVWGTVVRVIVENDG
jgi:hypothetical protein